MIKVKERRGFYQITSTARAAKVWGASEIRFPSFRLETVKFKNGNIKRFELVRENDGAVKVITMAEGWFIRFGGVTE